jgi:transcription-repair coupling factor (superfamily II helicase)
VDARIPDDYVDSERLRLEAYQKLSVASSPTSTVDQLVLVRDELTDRYGELPAPVETLFRISALRRRAYLAGLSEVVVMGSNLRITPLDLPDSKQVRLTRLYPGAKYVPSHRVVTIPLPEDASDLVAWVNEIFDELVTP